MLHPLAYLKPSPIHFQYFFIPYVGAVLNKDHVCVINEK